MGDLKGTAGYIWSIFALFVVLATFFANDFLAYRFASLTGLKVSPRYTGGEISRTIDHGTHRTILHRPVFDGLLTDRKEGFIQIDWESNSAPPSTIEERIDCDGDGRDDFLITLDTRKETFLLTPYNPSVVSIEKTYRLKTGWAVRVRLRRE